MSLLSSSRTLLSALLLLGPCDGPAPAATGQPMASAAASSTSVPGSAVPAAVSASTAAVSASADADRAKPPARCKVTGQGKTRYDGACTFRPEGSGGSFSVTPLDQPAMSGATVLTVSITSPGVAEVRGLTAAGINSRWGEARRSKADSACWEGSDFSVCAYAAAPGDARTAGTPKAVRQRHGESYWAVYTALGAGKETPEMKASIAALKGRGLELGVTFGVGSLGCDVGAAAALRKPDETLAVGVYFVTEAEARAFAASLTPKPVGVARIKAMCRG